MPARVLVFCSKSIAGLTPAMLVEELRNADLMTLAECLDLPGGEAAAVSEMWKCFRLDHDDASSIDGVELHWHPKHRPIQVRWGPPLGGELDELRDDLEKVTSKGAARVRQHLEATVEVVEFEMGVPGSLDLAATISEVLAFFVAERGEGLVLFYNRDFAAPDDRGATLLKR
jgi:hypothetical protein